MTRFKDIKVNDLVYINDKECKGWFIVFNILDDTTFDIIPLGVYEDIPEYCISKKDVKKTVKTHIRMAAVPGAIEALERIKAKLDALGTDLDGIYADAEDALRAVRGEESA